MVLDIFVPPVPEDDVRFVLADCTDALLVEFPRGVDAEIGDVIAFEVGDAENLVCTHCVALETFDCFRAVPRLRIRLVSVSEAEHRHFASGVCQFADHASHGNHRIIQVRP